MPDPRDRGGRVGHESGQARGAHGPGSRRTTALDDDTSHHLMGDAAIDRQLRELEQSTGRPPGRCAVTYERTLHGADRLNIYAAQYRDDAPPERVHLAQPYRRLLTDDIQPDGPLVALTDRSAPSVVAAPTAKGPGYHAENLAILGVAFFVFK